MTVTIDLTPTEQERVMAAARQKRQDPAEFIKNLITAHLPEIADNERQNGIAAPHMPDRNHFYFTATREQFNGALDEVAQMNKSLPVLTEAAFDRENLYEDRF